MIPSYHMHIQQVKLQKIGNSFMITIPKSIKEKSGLRLGDHVNLQLSGTTVTIKPKQRNKMPVSAMKGNLSVKGFSFQKTMKNIKNASYAR